MSAFLVGWGVQRRILLIFEQVLRKWGIIIVRLIGSQVSMDKTVFADEGTYDLEGKGSKVVRKIKVIFPPKNGISQKLSFSAPRPNV